VLGCRSRGEWPYTPTAGCKVDCTHPTEEDDLEKNKFTFPPRLARRGADDFQQRCRSAEIYQRTGASEDLLTVALGLGGIDSPVRTNCPLTNGLSSEINS
jgi:hypothetical protein